MEVLPALLVLAVLIAITVGYVLNIVKLAKSEVLTGLALLRVVGIVVPIIGMVIGYVNDKETKSGEKNDCYCN